MSDTATRTRINVRDEGNALQGWFVLEAATAYEEQSEYISDFDKVSVNTRSEFAHQTLYRTKKGSWVLCDWSDYGNVNPTYRFVSDDAAKSWLTLNDEDDAVELYFGKLEEESGPNLGGRPAIGPKVGIPMPEEAIAEVDTYAKAQGVSRAEAMRRLIEIGLKAQ